jgi:hypothetical protein
MHVLLMFQNDLERFEQALQLERVGRSLLLADVQVFHRSPLSHYSDGKGTMRLKQEVFSSSYPVSACRPAHGTLGQ